MKGILGLFINLGLRHGLPGHKGSEAERIL